MNGYQTYIKYLALKKHFSNSKYDYFKYNGKVNASKDRYQNRTDKYLFEKLSNKTDPVNRIISNIIVKRNLWIGDIVDDVDNYQNWLKRNQSLTYHFKNDISRLQGSFKDVVKTNNEQIPPLINNYINKTISIETLCLIDRFTKIFVYWREKGVDNIIINDINTLVNGYYPFIQYDKQKIKNTLVDRFTYNN